jgi:hypothetical protein
VTVQPAAGATGSSGPAVGGEGVTSRTSIAAITEEVRVTSETTVHPGGSVTIHNNRSGTAVAAVAEQPAAVAAVAAGASHSGTSTGTAVSDQASVTAESTGPARSTCCAVTPASEQHTPGSAVSAHGPITAGSPGTAVSDQTRRSSVATGNTGDGGAVSVPTASV